jgi:glycosyltransferase involved in cell wall biosynthesis
MSAGQVSVVIPTTGRPTLAQAVASALDQSAPPLEVIVVIDREAPPDDCAWSDPRVRVACTGGGLGGNGARQIGVDLARGDAIAFLDDDDYWFPEKLERQLALLDQARRLDRLGVVSAGMQVVDELERPLQVTPRRSISPEQPVSDYLFRRREVPYGEATMASSTLLVDRRLLNRVPLDCSLWLHEDWDWLVRAACEPDACFLMDPTPLLVYRRQPPGRSLSRGSRWRSSITWADSVRHLLSAREYGDLLLGITVSLAVDAGDRAGGWSTAVRGVRHGRPGLPALTMAALLLLLPGRLLERLSRLYRTIGGCGSRGAPA